MGGVARHASDPLLGAVRVAGLLSVVCATTGIVVGLLFAPLLVDIEPLIDFGAQPSDAAAYSCTRGYWLRTSPTPDASAYFGFDAWLELGTPTPRTLEASVRFDVSARGALLSKGVTASDADAVLAEVAAQRAALPADDAARRFGTPMIASEEIAASLVVDVLESSSGLRGCTTPVSTLPLSVCTDVVVLGTNSPNAAWRQKAAVRVPFIATPRAFLGVEAQRRGLDAELFLEAGEVLGVDSSATDGYGVSIGAASLCFFDATTDNPAEEAAPEVRGDTLRLVATREAVGDTLVIDAPAVPTTATCAVVAANAVPTTTVPFLPVTTADATSTLGSTTAVGLTDLASFRAATCGGAASDNVPTIACAAASGVRCAGGSDAPGAGGVFALRDVAERGLTLVQNGTDTTRYTLTVADARSQTYAAMDELTTALWRLALLVFVSLLLEQRARIGVSGPALLAHALNWAAGTPEVAGEDGDDDDDGDTAKRGAPHHFLAASLLTGLRIAQLTLSFEARVSSRMNGLLAFDLLSIALSIGTTALRLSTTSDTRTHELVVAGGAPWLLDAVCTLQSVSVTLPAYAPIATHGVQALARVTSGTLLLTQVVPRAAFSAASCAVCAASAHFGGAFRALSLVSAAVWCAQSLCVSLLASNLFLGGILYASSASFLQPAFVHGGIALVSAATLGLYVAYAFEQATAVYASEAPSGGDF